MKCSVMNCERTDIKVKDKALCVRHASQFYRYGKILERTNKEPSPFRVVGEVSYVTLFTKGEAIEVMFDTSDSDKILGRRWSFSRGYAVSWVDGKLTFMHCHLFGFNGIDHINGNGLDNRRSNLRVATQAQNMRNTKMPSHNSTGYKGVSNDAHTGRYRVVLALDGKLFRPGRFTDLEEAAWIYDQWALQLFGEYARTNFEYV